MAKRNRTKLAVLGFLTWKPMSGYEIKKAIDGSISNFWRESYGQIYPILQELAAEGLATSETVKGEGAREQTIYTITEAGRAELRDWLTEPAATERPRVELLLKLFFGRQGDQAACIRHVEAARARYGADLAELEDIERHMDKSLNHLPDAAYWRLTLRYGLALHRMQLAWAEESLAALRDLQSKTAAGADAAAPPNP